MSTSTTHTTVQLCTFQVAGLTFGVEVDRVQEVLRTQPMTRVPLASREVGGLINLRGQIVTAIDLRRRLGLPDRAANQHAMNVVIRTDDAPVILLVDEIGDVLDISADCYEPPPSTLTGKVRELTRGVHKLDSTLLLLLDTQNTVNALSA